MGAVCELRTLAEAGADTDSKLIAGIDGKHVLYVAVV
jgi:hypothetical protein